MKSMVPPAVPSVLALLVLGLVAPVAPATAAVDAPARASHPPMSDPFYHYTGHRPLRRIGLGTVLKKRTVDYHIAGVPLPLKAVQLLFRSTDQLHRPTADVTTVVRAVGVPASGNIVSYQSFYDSLSPADEPSVAIAGGIGIGDGIAYAETGLIAPLLLAGYAVNIPDTEGQRADFAAGPEYGQHTLDSLRAAVHLPGLGLTKQTKIGMLGYSGGAIATEWAAELAPHYAPAVSRHLVGSAFGGVLVDPVHNLHYVGGSLLWSGVMPQAIVGLARSFHIDLDRYLSASGRRILASLAHASIVKAIGSHPGLTWADLAKPRYPEPENVRVLVHIVNQLIMGTRGTPSSPLFIGQGTGGEEEGTSGSTPLGMGDGVMVAGDVRSLARGYCRRGVTVRYQQYAGLSHVGAAAAWLPDAYAWLLQRFAGAKAPSTCGSIPRGNSLAPATYVPAH